MSKNEKLPRYHVVLISHRLGKEALDNKLAQLRSLSLASIYLPNIQSYALLRVHRNNHIKQQFFVNNFVDFFMSCRAAILFQDNF